MAVDIFKALCKQELKCVHKQHLIHLTVHGLMKPQYLFGHDDLLLDQTFKQSQRLLPGEAAETYVGDCVHMSSCTNTSWSLMTARKEPIRPSTYEWQWHTLSWGVRSLYTFTQKNQLGEGKWRFKCFYIPELVLYLVIYIIQLSLVQKIKRHTPYPILMHLDFCKCIASNRSEDGT